MNNNINGPVVVTGAASGIGRATAARLRRNGVIVVGLDIEPAVDCDLSVTADLRNEDDVKRAIDQVLDTYGAIAGLVNSAGIAGFGAVHELKLDYWQRVLSVHLTGAMLVSRQVVRAMLEAKQGGSIVNVASIYGMTGGTGNIPYNVAKGGLLQLTRSMAADYGCDGIRVNAVSPGYIETPMSSVLSSSPDLLNAFVGMHLLQRPGQPDEVAAAIVFLLSDDASFITGANLPVDGGFSSARMIPDYSKSILNNHERG